MDKWSAALSHNHLPALDGLRAIAVFMVIFGHLNLPTAANLGVTMFFVLSGFLITWLLLREEASTGTVSLRRFYLRRSLRIFPAYFAFLVFSFALDAYLGDPRWKTMVGPTLTYTVNYYNALHNHPITSVAHTWSLAVEEQFYLLWPAAFLLFASKRKTFLLWAIGVVVAWRCTLWFGVHVSPAYVYNAFDTRFDNLAVGCLVAVLARTEGMIRVVPRLVSRWWFPLLTICALAVSRRGGRDYHYGPGLTVDALLLALLMIQLLVLSSHSAWKWLEHPVTRYLGRLSYSLYLYHAWGNGLGGKIVPTEGPLQMVAGVACSVLLAMGSYHVIEQPFLRLKRRFELVRNSPQQPPLPPAHPPRPSFSSPPS